ncbi:MAG: hypothetical protein ABR601_02360 [Parasphingopyxis sp.]|nr:hypothetical protein [Sphingomonadales bacterium]
MTMATGRRAWLTFLLLSLGAVAAGSVTLLLNRGAPSSVLFNPAGWLIGLALSLLLLCFGGGPGIQRAILAITPIGLAATLLAAPVEAVHRWIDIGPIHANMAALLIPAAIVAIARTGLRHPFTLCAIAAIATLLIAQPDASQATAFLLACWVGLIRERISGRAKLAALALAAVLAAVAWLRPDPLEAVAEVEGIVRLAWLLSPAITIFGVLALAGASLAPLAAAPSPGGSATMLAVYFATVALCTLFGNFPVPLIGLGMSFPLGYWLGIGLLCARKPDRPAARTA